MSGLFGILLVLSALGVAGAIVDAWRRRKEVDRLRDEHGEDYDTVRERWKQ